VAAQLAASQEGLSCMNDDDNDDVEIRISDLNTCITKGKLFLQ
jgi:hypothetical protein